MQHWWWAARGSTVSRQIREYKRNIKKREWIEEDVVSRDMQRDYFVKYTMTGRAKKRKKHEMK